MRVDIGFWDISGNYIEDLQEIDERELTMTNKIMEIMDDLNGMANNVLKYEPQETKTAKEKIIAIYDKIQDIFDNDTYVYSVKAESDEGYYMTEVETLPEDSLLEVRRLLDNIMDILEDE